MNTSFLIYAEGKRRSYPGIPLSSAMFAEKTWFGPSSAPATAWLALAQDLTTCGFKVTVLGTPDKELSGAESIIGLAVAEGNTGRRKPMSTVLISSAVLGGLEPEQASSEGVASAGALAMKLARLELGDVPLPTRVGYRAALCTWPGPMMVYRGSSAGLAVTGMDQRKAYLGALFQPLPARSATWALSGAADRLTALDMARRSLDGGLCGFALAWIEQGGEYPAWPSACAGDTARVCFVGKVLVAIPLFALAVLVDAGAVELIGLERSVTVAADPHLGDRIAARFEGLPKSVYQRLHSAATPCPRWSARMDKSFGLKWSLNQPDPHKCRPDVAAMLRSYVAAKTAVLLSSLPAGSVCAAHVDGVFETASGGDLAFLAGLERVGASNHLGFNTGGETSPGLWSVKNSGSWGRFYAPGRWDVGAESARMGMQLDGSYQDSETPLFLAARYWSGDPRKEPGATSEPRSASGEFYSYSWGSEVVSGVYE